MINIEDQLLPSWLGNEKTLTMLFGIYNVKGPSAIFLYGTRNVGKSVALMYMKQKFPENTEYIALDEEPLSEEEVYSIMDPNKVLILDEITSLETKHGTLGDLDKNKTRAFFRRFLRIVIEKSARVIFTASYSIRLDIAFDSLVRAYAKGLKRPKSLYGNKQPYRIYAIPRPMLTAYTYLFDKDLERRKRIPFALVKHVVPIEFIQGFFEYSYITPEKYLEWYKTLDSNALKDAFEKFLITGGYPRALKACKKGEFDAEKNEEMDYISSELKKVFKADKELELKLLKYFEGHGDIFVSSDMVEGLINTYTILPVGTLEFNDLRYKRIPEVMDILPDNIVPLPLDPLVANALLKYFSSERGVELKKNIPLQYEAAVALHLLYLQGYTRPKYRESLWPPIYRLIINGKRTEESKSIDFIIRVKADESNKKEITVPLLIEVKSTINETSEKFNDLLKRLARIGYALGVYPIILTNYELTYRRIPVRINNEELRKYHKKSVEMYYRLPSSPYEEEPLRYVNVMDFKYFFAAIPPKI